VSKWLRQTKTPARGRRPGTNRLFDIAVQFIHETPKAVLYDNGTKKFWVPKSAMTEDGYIQVESNADGSITLTAPESWLYEQGLI